MRFTISKSELQNALGIVSKGLASHSTMPVLSGILIEAYDNSIVLQSSDLELAIKHTCNALIEEEGKTVVPGKLFSDIIKSLPDAAVSISASDVDAHINCGNSTFSVRTLNANDFPGFPHVDASQEIRIPFGLFSNMVKRVSRVCSKDETRIIMTGICVTLSDGKLRMVATDSYRLALFEKEIEGSSADDFECVISGNFMRDVAALSDIGEDLILGVQSNQIIITYGATTFINRRIEGNFPNYQQLLSDEYTTRATFDLDTLTQSAKRASLMSSAGSGTASTPMRFDLDAQANVVQLTVNSPDVGSVQETLDAQIEGEDVQIIFNAHYTIDGLTAIPGDEVLLDIRGPLKPGIFRATGEEDFLYLIMPVHPRS